MGDFLSDAADVVSDAGDQVLQPLGLVKGDEEKARQRALEALNNLSAPNLSPIEYRDLLTRQADTALGSVDPRARDAQLRALAQLEEINAGGGLSAADRGRIEQINRQEAINEKGQREALLQNAQARGIGGSGLNLASQLLSQQAGANRAADRDIDVANLAQQRALSAIGAAGTLASNVRGQDYERARAQDIINQFNTDYLNRAGFMTGDSRANVPQQNFNNQLALAQARGGADVAKGQAADSRRGSFLDTAGQAAMLGSSFMGPNTQLPNMNSQRLPMLSDNLDPNLANLTYNANPRFKI